MAGLEDYGFQRKRFTEIKQDIQQRITDALGQSFNFTSDSYITKLVDNISLEIDEQWQLFEGVVNTRNINAAEGVYLDDLLSAVGVIRQGATKGTDIVMVGLDQSAPVSQTITTDAIISGAFDFNPQTNTLIGNSNTKAVFIPLEDNLNVNTNINIALTGREGSNISTNISYTDTTPQEDVEGLFENLVVLCRDYLSLTPEESGKCFYVAGEGAYIGFDISKNVDRLGVSITFSVTRASEEAENNLVYTRFSDVPIISVEDGFQNYNFGDLNDITPKPEGFVSLRNIGPIVNGSEFETDAAYRLRASRIRQIPNNSTKQSLEAQLLSLPGVSQARVYENPTTADRPEALAGTFNTVVLGGVSSDIIKTIFDKKPINATTSGQEFEDINLPGGITEKVYYTPAKQQLYSVLVQYKTRDRRPISTSESSEIIRRCVEVTNVAEIGDKIEIDSFKAIVYELVGFTRLDNVVVKVKGPEDLEFSAKDIVLEFDQYINIIEDNVSVLQVY